MKLMFIIIYIFFLFNFPKIQSKFFLNSQTSSIIVIRHRHLNTDNEYYRIRCPYHFKYLTITLLNYSNPYCFSLYSKSIVNFCRHFQQSTCQFYSKAILLNCSHPSFYSKQVDITYQCSSTINSTLVIEDNSSTILSSSSSSTESIRLHTFNKKEHISIGFFGLFIIVFLLLWLIICCLWLFRCHHLSSTTNRNNLRIKSMIVDNHSNQTTGGIDNLCLHINPFEIKCPS